MSWFKCDFLESVGNFFPTYVCKANGNKEISKELVNSTCYSSRGYTECYYYKSASSRWFFICTATVEELLSEEDAWEYINVFSRWRNHHFSSEQMRFYEATYKPQAEAIVENIKKSFDRRNIFEYLLNEFVDPMYVLVNDENYEEAYRVFVDLFTFCQKYGEVSEDYISRLATAIENAEFFSQELLSTEGDSRNLSSLMYLVYGNEAEGDRILKTIAARAQRDGRISVCYENVSTLKQLLKSYQENDQYHLIPEQRAAYSDYDLLILLNFEEVIKDENLQRFMFELLNSRYSHGVYTAISSKLSPTQLVEEHGVDERLIQRIKYGFKNDLRW